MTSSHSLPSSLFDKRHIQREERPLIDRVTNSWRDKSGYADSSDDEQDYNELPHCCDLDSESNFISVGYAFFASRKVRRTMFLLLVALAAFYFVCKTFLYPAWRERQDLLHGLDSANTFGHGMPNKLDDIIQLRQLDPQFIPGGESDPEGKRRLIFVGDIHGCKDELSRLLDSVKFKNETDKLIATGDIVAKGPDSPGVIDTLIEIDALSVRGNHEDRVLLAAKSRSITGAAVDAEDEPSAQSKHGSKGAGLKGEALLDYFKHRHIKYLRSLPLILHIPAITPPSIPAPELSKAREKRGFQILHNINVVHAGLVPSVPLYRQDPFSVMNMRSMSASNHVPSEKRKSGIAWEKVWGWYNDRIARSRSPFITWLFGHAKESSEAAKWWSSWNGQYGGGSDDDPSAVSKHITPSVVIYGHDSPRGLNLKKWSKGLDTGCVNGKKLTALILDAWGRAEIISVDCKSSK